MSALLVEECLRPSQRIPERESLDVVEASAHGSEDDGLGPQVGRAHIRDSQDQLREALRESIHPHIGGGRNAAANDEGLRVDRED